MELISSNYAHLEWQRSPVSLSRDNHVALAKRKGDGE